MPESATATTKKEKSFIAPLHSHPPGKRNPQPQGERKVGIGNADRPEIQGPKNAKDRHAPPRHGIVKLLPALILLAANPLHAADVMAKNPAGLKDALRGLAPGDTLRIAPGDYPGGHFVERIANLTIEALDPAKPPHFIGGNQAWHFVRCPGLTLRRIRVSGQKANGINIDDGGERSSPVDGILLDSLEVSDIGPNGNFDAIKCSGLRNLTIRDCRISGWGGQAIDLVGCRKALITGCTITGKPGFSQNTGPQFKGGCEDVVIEKCHLKDAGQRPVQAGGSTGMDYFRPPGATFEARRIVIRDNVIEGGMCACAFTGVDGAEFTGNTIRNPDKWIFRILQETKAPGFPPCRNVLVANNSFVFQRSKVRDEINIGPDTAPETFRFENNRWLAEDRPGASKPKLPVEEKITLGEWVVTDWSEWKLQETAPEGKRAVVPEVAEAKPVAGRPPMSDAAKKAGVLVLGPGEPLAIVKYEGKQPLLVNDYEISWEAMRLDGSDFFAALTFPVGSAEQCATFVNGGWGGWVTGISCLQELFANENETTGSIEFEQGRWYQFILQVNKDCLRALVDGRELFKVGLKGRTISMHPSEIRKSMPLGFASYNTKGAIRNVRVRPLKPGELAAPEEPE